METCFLLEHGPCAPAWNMACDEWLLMHAAKLGRPVLRFYEWDRPSVTIGYFQPFPDLPRPRHTVIRRPTGGALVVHDADLTFTVVLPPSHPWCRLPTEQRYERVHERVQEAFRVHDRNLFHVDLHRDLAIPTGRSSMNLRCFEKISRYDVVLEGVKVAGGAQRVNRSGLLHQGSIQGGDLRITPEDMRTAWEGFGTYLIGLHLNAAEMREISELAETKYESPEWNERVISNSQGLIPSVQVDRIRHSELLPVT